MPNPKTSEKSAYLDRDEHISKGDVGTKKVTVYYYDSGTDELKPINSTNPLPVSATIDTTGLATSAKQDAQTALLTTIDTDTGNIATEVAGLLTDTELRATPVPISGTITETNSAAIKTAVETLDNAISGSEMQVDVVGALPAGTNNIGDVDVLTLPSIPAGNNNIGDVDVASLPVAFNTGTRSATTQRVTIATNDSLAVTNAGTFATQAAQSGTWNIATVTTLTGITNALPAGTNAIGKLAANSGVDIGDVDVTSSVSATLDHGSNLDIDTTAEQITTTSFAAKFGVTVKSAATNTDTVYIGNSDVTAGTTAATDGFPLEPGESITLPVNNSNLLYAIGASANQKVFWSAV